MVVTVLWRAAANAESGAGAAFSDVAQGAWYHDAVAWAAGSGIVTGYGDGRFGPGDNITRQDLTVLLTRYADFMGIDTRAIREYEIFIDNDAVAAYASEAVERAFRAGIINGRGNGVFDPSGRATRAEFAAMLKRFIG